MRLCKRCRGDYPITHYRKYHGSLYRRGGRRYGVVCKTCREKLARGRASTLLIDRQRSSARGVAHRNQAYVFDHLVSHPCVDCGEVDVLVLEFDHVRGEKRFNIGQHKARAMAALQEELKKCEVVCANCHSRRTHRRANTARFQQAEQLGLRQLML
jgi:hypothetical protein